MSNKEEVKALSGISKVQDIVNDNEIDEVYVNGFIVSTTHSDVVIVFSRNNHPFMKVNMSLTNLKTLGKKISQIVDEFEKISGMNIMTSDEIKLKFNEHNSKK